MSDSITDIKNYRPIAVLTSLLLMFERLVYKHFKHLFQNQLCSELHCICIVRSTITRLLTCCDKLYYELEAKKKPVSIFLDIANAFDTINFRIMIHKFSQFGFDEKFLVFLKLYLLGGQKRVVISNLTSNYSNVSSEGTQCLVFAVFLFSVYIYDLPEVFLNENFLFADDKKLVDSKPINQFYKMIMIVLSRGVKKTI